MVRAVEVHQFRKSWSVELRFLSYRLECNLNDSEFTQAYISGPYDDVNVLIECVEEFVKRPLTQWINFSRSGYFISLSSEHMHMYETVPWSTWVPNRILIPKNSTFEVIRPLEWQEVELYPVS